jgi:hypothetical protein
MGEQRAGFAQVVEVAALAGQEAMVLQPGNRLATLHHAQ